MSSLSQPPVPIAASQVGPLDNVSIIFDKLLQAGEVDPNSWTVRSANQRLFVDVAEVLNDEVTLEVSVDAPEVGPDIVSYDASLNDLIGENELPVVAFTDFPVV